VRLIITSDQHYERTRDGAVWTRNQFAYSYWLRYLEEFREVAVVARVCDVDAPPPESQRADGDCVRFIALPEFLGPIQFAWKLPRIAARLRAAVAPGDAVILRLPSGIGIAGGAVIRQPYAVEVVADPFDAFARAAAVHPLRPVVRLMLTQLQRMLCHGAAVAGYVTERALQNRYPTRGLAFAVSDVELPSSAFVDTPRDGLHDADAPVLIGIGTMAALYKGQDNLLRAFAVLRRRGSNARLRLAGGGRHADEFRQLAVTLGVADRVEFLGNLAGSIAARPALDAADVFVLGSRAEGMSRALLEAMARGLPCVATAVGGTPEVLPKDVLARPNDPEAFADAVERLLASRERLQRASAMNLARARDFHEDRLAGPRRAFLREVVRTAVPESAGLRTAERAGQRGEAHE
jgi:glycosyltransferase involved in cell wall biosynthesis